MTIDDVNNQVVGLITTTKTIEAAVAETGKKLGTVETSVGEIKNLVDQIKKLVTPPAPDPLAKNKLIADRLHGLTEIFYGLAIASGLQFIATYIFAPNPDLDPAKGDYPIGSDMWYVMLWSVGVALLASISDWFDSAQRHPKYTRPAQVICDLLFTLALFFMFVGAYRFEVFLGAVGVYSVVAIYYISRVAKPARWGFKVAFYGLIIVTCGSCIAIHGRYRADSPIWIPAICIPGVVITVLLFKNMVVRWTELRALFKEM